MEFRATVELGGKTATGIEVPAEIVSRLGSHRRPPVLVTINGHTYRTTVATMGGRHLVPVSAEVRSLAGVAAGDTLDVGMVLDDAPREVVVPDDLASALRTAGVRERFDALSFTRRKEYVRAVEQAKAAATRDRRVAKAVTELQDRAARRGARG